MSSIKLKHASGNGVSITAPSSNPGADRTLELPGDADGIIAKTDASGNLAVTGDLTVDTDTLKVDSSNNRVGVGTASPSGKVHANSAANTATFLAEGEVDNPSYPAYGFAGQNADNGSRGAGMYLPGDSQLAFSTAGSERWKFDGSGNIFTNGLTTQIPGLGNTTTGLGMELQNGSIFLSRADGASLYVNVNGSGDRDLAVYRQNGVVVGAQKTQSNSLPSDQNVKKDITTLNLGLDFVNKLAPKQFRFNLSTDTDPLCFGLIAQELETSLTSSGVTKNSTLLLQHKPNEDAATSDYWLDYSKLIPILINSVKELSTKVETLETEKAKLQTDLTALTARVAALEAS